MDAEGSSLLRHSEPTQCHPAHGMISKAYLANNHHPDLVNGPAIECPAGEQRLMFVHELQAERDIAVKACWIATGLPLEALQAPQWAPTLYPK